MENGEWKMNAMAECWPLRLNVCKSLETVRRGRRTLRYSVIIECILRKLLLAGVKFVWKRNFS